MTEVFYAIGRAGFQGSIVILAVLILRLLLKKAPRGLFCLLWLLAGLRLALPFEIQSPFSLQPRLEETNITTQAEKPVQNPADGYFDSQPQQNLSQQSPELPEIDWEDIPPATYPLQHVTIPEPVSYGEIAAGIWAVGLAAMLTASAVSYFRLKRRVREACLVENGCFECPGLETAFVLGFMPPKIYLPVGLTDREKAFICDHENTHIARHDHWFKLLGYLVLSIHWFNPLVWLAYHLLCRDMELACDEHVVRNMTLPERKAYSSALLSCGSHTARLAACPVAFGESNPKRRIMNVLNYKRPTFWISLLAVIAVIFVSVCLLTSPEEREPLERLSKALEDYQSKGSWHIQTKFIYENRPAATRCEMDIWQEEDRWYRVSSLELADGNLNTTGYVSEHDVQYTFFVSGVYHPEYRSWSPAEEDERWYPYWLPRFELKDDEISEIREEKTGDGSIIITVLDAASAGEQYTQLYIHWHLDKEGTLTHVERYEQFTTTEDGETFLMGIRMDISLLPDDAETVKAEIDSVLAELPEDAEPEQPAWTLDMSGEEYLAMCRDAVAELQSREQYHISETLVYYNGETEDSRSNVAFWRDGENWLRESYVTRMQQNRNLLYYDGLMYMQWQKDGEEAVWDLVDSADGDLQGMTWLHWLRWDSQNVTFQEISQEGDELCVSVTVYAAPPTLGWEDVREYGIQFFFDKTGSLTRAIMNAERGNIRVEDDLTIETTMVGFIHNKLENVAAQLFPETCTGLPLADEAYLEKCRTALEEYQSMGVWAIQEENSFWGQGVLNTSSVSQWFGYGEDYLKWAAIPESTHDSVWWDLRMNGEAYHRQGWIGENGEESASPWEKGSTDNQTIYPHWPLRYNWVGADIQFVEQRTEDSMDYVTVTIQGSPFPEDPDPIREYRVTFFFLHDVLQSVELTYERTDSLGGCTRHYDLYACAPSYAVNKISQYYDEAVAQTGKNG
ncbi:MAG: M56 family metallopeptidase [Oscillospiraceae bacterium]|nr:M56 family metallopeptidase [Oscillospiraceae bacterium]